LKGVRSRDTLIRRGFPTRISYGFFAQLSYCSHTKTLSRYDDFGSSSHLRPESLRDATLHFYNGTHFLPVVCSASTSRLVVLGLASLSLFVERDPRLLVLDSFRFPFFSPPVLSLFPVVFKDPALRFYGLGALYNPSFADASAFFVDSEILTADILLCRASPVLLGL